MEARELQEKLVSHYKYVIDKISGVDLDEAKRIGFCEFVDSGICGCAYKKFDADIFLEEWVYDQRQPESVYWCKPVRLAKTTEEMIELLKIRVEILQKILNQNHTK